MQISSVFAGYPDPGALGGRGETASPAERRPSAGAENPAASAAARSTFFGEILVRYDVTDITAREFSEMIQQLQDAGAISREELQQLAMIRLDLDAEGVDPDDAVDLLEFYAEKIEDLRRRLGESGDWAQRRTRLGPLLVRLDWIQKFALIQSAPDAVGLDATA